MYSKHETFKVRFFVTWPGLEIDVNKAEYVTYSTWRRTHTHTHIYIYIWPLVKNKVIHIRPNWNKKYVLRVQLLFQRIWNVLIAKVKLYKVATSILFKHLELILDTGNKANYIVSNASVVASRIMNLKQTWMRAIVK